MSRVFIERFLPRARHIEVQVLADAHGDRAAPGRARVLAAAPPPEGDRGVALAGRRRGAARPLGAEAVALARAAGYVNAGTVEFIADCDDPAEHYFLEMNARLQVEHPVTELVTGLDLVEQQLRVAAGEPLALDPGRLTLGGHAIEARINAEDATRDFLPTAGRCSPTSGPPACGSTTRSRPARSSTPPMTRCSPR